ncbi:MAG: monoamine oxidase [Polyangiales bacterium]
MLIVGGGLSGLSLATKLHAADIDFHLVEARDRFGGRIHSPQLSAGDATAAFDLGPAWFWPGQARMEALALELGATVFSQWDQGELVFEDERGRAQRADFSPMAGSLRIDGGMGVLIDALVAKLPNERLHLGHAVSGLHGPEPRVHIGDHTIECDHVVLALPPRVAATMEFSPALDADVLAAMHAVPTWMAGHAKVLALYERPFWREHGLSGDAMSRRGPLVEVHDASPLEGGPYALFGFVGVSAENRSQAAFLDSVRAQLAHLFGEEGGAAQTLHLQDWALEVQTSTPLDRQAPHGHPDYGMPTALRDVWDGSALLFASSEMASDFGGYLEGALAAAEAAARTLVRK